MKLGHLQARYFGNKMFDHIENMPSFIANLIAEHGTEEDVEWLDVLLAEHHKAKEAKL